MSTQAHRGNVPEVTIHHRIRIAREFAGLEQGELAGATGISRSTISNYESGATTHLKSLYLRQIAMATGVPLEWLQTGSVPSSGDGVSVKDRRNGRVPAFIPFDRRCA